MCPPAAWLPSSAAEVYKGRPFDAVLDTIVKGGVEQRRSILRLGLSQARPCDAAPPAPASHLPRLPAPLPSPTPPPCSLSVLKKGGTYVNFMPAPLVGMMAKG